MTLKLNEAGIAGYSYHESDSKLYVEINHDIFEYRHVPEDIYIKLHEESDPVAFILNQIDTKFEKVKVLPDDY